MKTRFARLVKFTFFASIGGLVLVIGLGLQWSLMQVGIAVTVAYTIQLIVSIVLIYELNRRITWRDRSHSIASAFRFYTGRVATSLLSWGLFWVLIHTTTVNPLFANFLTVIAATVVNYFVSELWAFRSSAGIISPNQIQERIKVKKVMAVFNSGSKKFAVAFVLLLIIFASVFFWHYAQYGIFGFLAVAAVLSFVSGSLEFTWRGYTSNSETRKALMGFIVPKKSQTDSMFFTFIVPAYHEAQVIAQTLEILANQQYSQFEVLVSLRTGDDDTIEAAKAVEAKYPSLIKVFVNDFMVDQKKSAQMNAVLPFAQGQYVSPVDAESMIATHLLRHVLATVLETEADVVQGGVQLTNLDTVKSGSWWKTLVHFVFKGGWTAPHSVMEYRFWFKSRMHYQADLGFIPLGGNTVFIRTDLLNEVGGWDDSKLTEDAALGVTLSAEYNVKVVVAYSAEQATQEHTPPHIFGSGGLFDQRVRWDQGFWQILQEGKWRKLPTLKQRLMALYILGTPLIAAASGLMMVLAVACIALKAPIVLTLFLFVPFAPLMLTLIMQVMELREFSREFAVKAAPRHYLSLIIGFFPYQFLLGIAGIVSVVREARGEYSWSKTSRNASFHTYQQVPVVQSLIPQK